MTLIEELQRIRVWNKWKIVIWYNPNLFRKDIFWSFIKISEYWNEDSIYWWHIDHIIPQNKWWSDDIKNLQPLQWKNNIKKSDKILKPIFLKQNPLKKKINLFDFRLDK